MSNFSSPREQLKPGARTLEAKGATGVLPGSEEGKPVKHGALRIALFSFTKIIAKFHHWGNKLSGVVLACGGLKLMIQRGGLFLCIKRVTGS